MKNAETLDLALAELKIKGYAEDFQNLPSLEGYHVEETFQFAEAAGPGGKVLYALRAGVTGRKGFVINPLGIYSKPLTNIQIQALERWENEGGKILPR